MSYVSGIVDNCNFTQVVYSSFSGGGRTHIINKRSVSNGRTVDVHHYITRGETLNEAELRMTEEVSKLSSRGKVLVIRKCEYTGNYLHFRFSVVDLKTDEFIVTAALGGE